MPSENAAMTVCRQRRPGTGWSIVRIGRLILGTVCLILGMAGLFLPFLQGVLLLLVGLKLLSAESDRARRWLGWLRSYTQRGRIPAGRRLGR